MNLAWGQNLQPELLSLLFNQRLVTVPFSSKALDRRNHELSVLLELSNFLSTCTDLETLLHGGLEMVRRQFGLKAGRIYLGEPEEGFLYLAAHQGLEPDGLETLELEGTFSGKAAATRSFLAMRVEDIEDKQRSALLTRKGFVMVICLPLITRDRVLGVMNLNAPEMIHLEMATVDLGMVMCNLIATSAESVIQAQELMEKADMLEEQKKAVQFFAYTACHDMKSPAAGVHGLARLLLARSGDRMNPKDREVCRQIEKASARIENLAGEINGYIWAKESALDREEVELGEVLAEIAAEQAGRLEKAGVVFETPPEPVWILADRLALGRALDNLVDNALKYGGPELSRIRVSCQDKDSQWVLCVEDDGVGIPDELAKKVFTLFKRAATSQGTEGTGLGLAIVQEIARRHGGRAWLEPGQGSGASFCLSLAKAP